MKDRLRDIECQPENKAIKGPRSGLLLAVCLPCWEWEWKMEMLRKMKEMQRRVVNMAYRLAGCGGWKSGSTHMLDTENAVALHTNVAVPKDKRRK